MGLNHSKNSIQDAKIIRFAEILESGDINQFSGIIVDDRIIRISEKVGEDRIILLEKGGEDRMFRFPEKVGEDRIIRFPEKVGGRSYTEQGWPNAEPVPPYWLIIAGRTLKRIGKTSFRVLRHIIYYTVYRVVYKFFRILKCVCKGIFYSLSGLIYFVVGFFGNPVVLVILAVLAVVAVVHHVYENDPDLVNQHILNIQNKSAQFVQDANSKLGDFMDKMNPDDLSSKVGNMSSKAGDILGGFMNKINSDDLSSRVGNVSSKVGDFVSKSKNDIWAKFDWPR